MCIYIIRYKNMMSRNNLFITAAMLACMAVLLLSCGGKKQVQGQTTEVATADTENISAYAKYLDTPFSGKPMVVDFYATWCGPCRMMSGSLDKVAGKYQFFVDVVRIDIDEKEDFARAAGISSIPTLFFVDAKGGITRQTGYMEEAELDEAFAAIAGKE